MKTNYPKSKPRKIRVRAVKSSQQPPVLNTENVVDTRKKEGGFGGTFFLKLTDHKTEERRSWKKLEKKLVKRINSG